MSDFITVKHSFNAGDLIVLMAGLKKLHQTHKKRVIIYQVLDFPAFYYDNAYSPIRDNVGQQVCMNLDMYNRLKPLIEYQQYIHSFEIYKGQDVQFNIDITRDSRLIPMPSGLLHFYNTGIFPEMCYDFSKPWLDCPAPEHKSEKFIINRTHRYTNAYIDYFFLKKYEEDAVFLGTLEENKDFCKRYELDIPLIQRDNFLQVATEIKKYRFGIYNQSFLFHLADAMKTPRILELCPQFPNTFPFGSNGFAFYHQKALEYYFVKIHQNDLRS